MMKKYALSIGAFAVMALMTFPLQAQNFGSWNPPGGANVGIGTPDNNTYRLDVLGNIGVQPSVSGIRSQSDQIAITGLSPLNTGSIGVYGQGPDAGVWGDSPFSFGIYGTSSSGFAGWFSGLTWCTQGVWAGSDARFKSNVQPIGNALQTVSLLEGVTYDWKTDEFPNYNFSRERSYGFIAQDVQQVLPEAIREDKDGYLGVNYDYVIPVLVEAIKEQQAEIEELKAQLNAAPKGENGSSSLDLDEQGRLMQNNPNPFNETTVIEFFLPDNAQSAELMVYNMEGVQVIRQQVTQKGFGRINVAGGDLQAGIYIYTLMIDGRAIDSKRMILSK